ncbi:uncharacterized protein BP5553_10487 [Venustampulla echinocandica]|uniref:Uncharacterized protein n=1 Tax=Venustampulla echinocandica TaxID=2656787 RepID=A0A370T9H7_9HELO|nr:uncharacterized protein BP5553_10487 [Venustampulla echinocandica]RDL30209.1 hypothetical protein BP5553_10487 [Venustampulla echinocandica]
MAPSELISDLDSQYHTIRRIGPSTCQGFSRTSGERVAIKLEATDHKTPRLLHETNVFKKLAGNVGVPILHYSGTIGLYHFAIFDPQGPTLEELFESCSRKFRLKTVILIADQLISRIEEVHAQSWILGQIEASSFAIGERELCSWIRIIKLRDAQPLKSSTSTACTTKLQGTLNTAPLYKDLERLGYTLLYFLRGYAPRQNQQNIGELCRDLPREFLTYFYYVRSPRLGSKPNYLYLKEVFNGLFRRKRFEDRFVFDWTIRKYFPLQTNTASPEFIRDEAKLRYKDLLAAEEVCKKEQASVGQIQLILKSSRALVMRFYRYLEATQHPAASESLRNSASELDVPTRLWNYGISRPFHLLILQLLTHRSPESLPTLEGTWAGYLSTLARYRMSIEDAGNIDGEIWRKESVYWASLRDDSTRRLELDTILKRWISSKPSTED